MFFVLLIYNRLAFDLCNCCPKSWPSVSTLCGPLTHSGERESDQRDSGFIYCFNIELSHLFISSPESETLPLFISLWILTITGFTHSRPATSQMSLGVSNDVFCIKSPSCRTPVYWTHISLCVTTGWIIGLGAWCVFSSLRRHIIPI